jgi:nickel-type superoxide dismutase maturation protease
MLLLSKFKVSGHSMEPFIKNNSLVLTSGVPYLFKNPKINDIVAFKEDKDGIILIKRITKNEKDGYFVQGDNKSDSLDSRQLGRISKRQIIGKVIYKI